jgi:hypothetical protein
MISCRRLAFLLLLVPVAAHGDMGDYAKNFLDDLESRNAPVFYSRCGVKQGGGYTATLIFEMGKKTGLLIEARDETVINLATVGIGINGPVIEETHGGVYTYERAKKLVEELVGYNFSLLIPMRVKVLEEAKPLLVCVNGP